MSSDPSGIDLRLLEAQLRNLTINVTVINSGEPSSASTSASFGRRTGEQPARSSDRTAAAASAAPPAEERSASAFSWAHRAAPVDCPPAVLRLGRNLRAVAAGSGEDRVKAAYQKGREAASIIRGEIDCYISDTTSSRRVCYVVLLAEGIEEPFVTFNRSVYFKYVKTGPGGTWNPESVSHGFASQAEAEAYCFGAGLHGLPRRRDQ